MAETDVRSNRFSRQIGYVHCFADKVKRFPGLARRETWKVGKDDPRRVVHAFKVGIALTIVSLLYLMEPLFKGIGQNAMWAVMTVVVCWVLGSLPMWRKGPKFEKPMSHLNLVERRL